MEKYDTGEFESGGYKWYSFFFSVNLIGSRPQLATFLLGSRTLGLNVLELHCVMLANHYQNVLVFVLDLLKVCLYVKLESSVLQDLLCKSVQLDRSRIRLDRSKLVQIVFLQNFQLSPSPFDIQGFMFCLKYKRENPSHVFGCSLCCVCESFVRLRGGCLHAYLGFPRFKIMSRTW